MQKEPTKKAAGKRNAGANPPRKLSRAEKKQIAEVIRQAKGDGKAHTAQQTIPYLTMYPDGICKVSEKKYSKSIAFEDINYQLAQADDKTAIFENWCDFLNYFDASVSVQLSFINQGTRREQAEKAINIPAQDDAFNSIRTEYSDMLKNQLSKGNNGLVKHKYITFSIEADNPAAAKARLSRIETDVLNNFKVLGASARPMTGYERLNVLHGVFHPEGEPFSFDFSWLAPSGLSTKDFIAPSSFHFGEGRYFRMGRKIGAVSFLEILAPELNDRMLADILDLETGVIVNLHIRSIDQTEASVNCCVTSPPYYALRDYGLDAQIGREDTPEEYIERLVAVFHELKRVLRSDGTFWLNIADTYCGTGNKGYYADPKNPKGRNGQQTAKNARAPGCKQKDLIGIPWLLAFALRADGWYLRSDIIWQKENPMPESCKDRPSRCYEHIFLLTKSKKYFYDAAAIAEPVAATTAARYRTGRGAGHKYADEVPGQGKVQGINRTRSGGYYDEALIPTMRNKRDVWLINTVPYSGGHFAAYPPKLAETCILAGCPKGGVVIDPFLGSGTTAAVAKSLDRHYIGIELNIEYCALARARIGGVKP